MKIGPNGLPVVDIAELKRAAASNAIRERMSAGSYKDQRNNKSANKSSNTPGAASTVIKEISIPYDGMLVRDLASKLSMRLAGRFVIIFATLHEIIKPLLLLYYPFFAPCSVQM